MCLTKNAFNRAKTDSRIERFKNDRSRTINIQIIAAKSLLFIVFRIISINGAFYLAGLAGSLSLRLIKVECIIRQIFYPITF